MSKKDYIALAAALQQSRPIMPSDSDRGKQWRKDVRAIADACARTNIKFNRTTFYNACQATGEWEP